LSGSGNHRLLFAAEKLVAGKFKTRLMRSIASGNATVPTVMPATEPA
jgi:hypothetical protein